MDRAEEARVRPAWRRIWVLIIPWAAWSHGQCRTSAQPGPQAPEALQPRSPSQPHFPKGPPARLTSLRQLMVVVVPLHSEVS